MSRIELFLNAGSILCFISTLFTLSTFLLDRERFLYPERCIIYMALCYLGYSATYLLRFFLTKDQVVCESALYHWQTRNPPPPLPILNHSMKQYEQYSWHVSAQITKAALTNRMKLDSIPLVSHSRGDNLLCLLSFVLTYFSHTAAFFWWTVLTFTWFLTSGMKWSSEGIARYSTLYHLLCWGASALLCITVVALGAVDGDFVTGLCTVGNISVLHLRIFHVLPLAVTLPLGSGLLVVGFISLYRIRKVIKQGEAMCEDTVRDPSVGKVDSLERLMVRIGGYSFCYTLPALVLLTTYVYEYYHRPLWMAANTCDCLRGKFSPNFLLMFTKYFMPLIMGTSSGIWVWNVKSLRAWMTLFQKIVQRNTMVSPTLRPGVASTATRVPSGSGGNNNNVRFVPFVSNSRVAPHQSSVIYENVSLRSKVPIPAQPV